MNKSWQKLGRIRRSTMPSFKNNRAGYHACIGRSVCDLKISSKELIRARAYDLHTLWDVIMATGQNSKRFKREFLKMYTEKQVLDIFTKSDNIFDFVTFQLVAKCYQIYQMIGELQAIPLAIQITKICGNILNRTFSGGRSERNEYLLLHAFYATKFKYLWPEKQEYSDSKKSDNLEDDADFLAMLDPNANFKAETTDPKATKSRSKQKANAYIGGLVLEPKKGFYDKYVLLLDFNSLYPSIIQEYNVCYTKTDQSKIQEEIADDTPETSGEFGILPTQIRDLVNERRNVKKILKFEKDEKRKNQLDIKQKAYKLTANSMYGCLGFKQSRFYAMPLAALVTRKGREALMRAKEMAENLGLDVIYGDTDSIMIYTNSNNYSEVMQLGQKVKTHVNQMFNLLEIEIDGIFKSMLLLKKKKYAALVVEGTDSKNNFFYKKELKGLDIVRRDWCTLAKQTGEYIVSQILTPDITMEDAITQIRDKLMNIAENIESLPLAQFIITKELRRLLKTFLLGTLYPDHRVIR